MMMRASCATCHGSDGRGRTTQMFRAPNITYPNLTNSQGMLAPDGSRGPTYTDAAIRKAVTQGIDPTGARLAAPMPQWQLTDREWADLLAYLKRLH
jgi:mono/diheme cytochrome c family protein